MEYTKKCNVCGKVFCYTDEDIRENASNSLMAGLNALGGLASLGGGTIFHTQHFTQQGDRYSDKVVNFDQCPYCHSRDVTFCTKEEAAALERKASAPAVTINSGASTEALLKRAFMFLEDGDWFSAEAYSEACLDKDPELAEAYLVKLMAELKVKERYALKDQAESFEDKSSYRKALRFADEQLKTELFGYIEHIEVRNENARKDETYRRASTIMLVAKSESGYMQAKQLFRSIPGWKDADTHAQSCDQKIEELREQEKAARLERERQEEITRLEKERARQEAAQRAKRYKKIALIAAPIVCAIGAALAILITVIIPMVKYNNAVALMDAGKYEESIAAFFELGDYKDTKELRFAAWQETAVREAISTNSTHTVGLTSNGTIVTTGNNDDGQCDVSSWTDIVAISAGEAHTIGLKSDGTVVAAGYNKYGQCDIRGWTDIVAISASAYHTVGLKSDGTVVAVGEKGHGRCNVSDWTNIVAISAGVYHTVGLKSDGTAVAVGNGKYSQCRVSDWTNIVAIHTGAYHTVGLKSDGTVVAVGDNRYNQCDISDWTDIVAVHAGDYHTIGLKSNGTVVAAGDSTYGQCDVSDWTDIVAICTGDAHTIGLKSDGTVVATGNNKYGQCDISGWTDIKLP